MQITQTFICLNLVPEFVQEQPATQSTPSPLPLSLKERVTGGHLPSLYLGSIHSLIANFIDNLGFCNRILSGSSTPVSGSAD